jgi:hypothetical protein
MADTGLLIIPPNLEATSEGRQFHPAPILVDAVPEAWVQVRL